MIKKRYYVFFTVILCSVFVFQAPFAGAINIGDVMSFNVDADFEKSGKSQIQATLVKTSSHLYFYVEKDWWALQPLAKQHELINNLEVLSLEFPNRIYPTLTSVFGSEWKPGVDGDDRITLLLHPMKDGAGGYFRSADEYIKLQVPSSNEREMLYLPIAQIDNIARLKVFLAHEFVHLITFNQKDRIQGVQEDIWLNELRAEYSSTMLGYNEFYEDSNLQSRVRDFLEKPSDSLVEWQEGKYDYAVANLFLHYLTDHYGINILSDSLKSKLTGIASINEALKKNNYEEDFSQVFTNWTITMAINDCSLSLYYCYLNKHLGLLKVNPALIFLPISGVSSLSVTNVTKNWSGNWQKIIGGKGKLTLKFSSLAGLNFKIPYIVFGKELTYSIKLLTLDENQEAEINLEDFGNTYNALILMPSLQTKMSDFGGFELTYPYTINLSINGGAVAEDQLVIEKLLLQIESLKKQIAQLQASRGQGLEQVSCGPITANLYVGLLKNSQVSCLQQLLASQGPDIYPEGLVTGNFGNLTRNAVIRFQEKYKNDILIPIGLTRGTGFVGALTRAKINSLLKVN